MKAAFAMTAGEKLAAERGNMTLVEGELIY